MSGKLVEYLVDGQGRRVGKKVDGTVVRQWLYRDQLHLVAELDAIGNVVSRFVYGTRVNVPDYVVKGRNTYRLIHAHLGSVRLVVDVATGVVAQRIDYSEWGVVLNDTATGFQPFGFAGGFYDPDTGLVRFGARDYDAETGRWTGKDPARFGGKDVNLYQHAFADPINFKDSRGLIVFQCTRWGVGWSSWIRHRYTCVWNPGQDPSCYGHGGEPEEDVFDLDQCEPVDEGECMDLCVSQLFDDPNNFRENYSGFTNNCYQFSDRIIRECKALCKGYD
jgi:RHS repeat-associated protein